MIPSRQGGGYGPQLESDLCDTYAAVGELSLEGKTRRVKGALSIAIAAARDELNLRRSAPPNARSELPFPASVVNTDAGNETPKKVQWSPSRWATSAPCVRDSGRLVLSAQSCRRI